MTSISSTKNLPLRALVIIGIIITLLFAAWQLLPRTGLSTDLQPIGQGTPVLVLTRDIHYLGGADVLDMLKPMQIEYAPGLLMRVAHQGHETSRQFSERHGSRDGDLLLFDAEGELLGSLQVPKNQAMIRQWIASLLP
ncbi:MAG: hypothetical protein WAV92_07020 [Halopseudomonas yangmingensis]|uniref:Uncharacterized protein n=1 Tax=Halopseudomonas yangmingensis TaxID=1720063 RepID=A0A1I4RQ68_9GAMM|nr:hypothetical protein [Halopseudomonas yangmingensis]SFM54351.1 hypothetical protein SAMN05216217_107121 [Halopseudomonas yangmingensis]